MSDVPRLHDVVLLTRSLPTEAGSVDIVQTVIVDGMELTIPDDAEVVITARAGGMQSINVDIVAAHIEYQTLEEQP